MELSDIQASKGLNRRFFKGVGSSVERSMAALAQAHHYPGKRSLFLVVVDTLPGSEQVPL